MESFVDHLHFLEKKSVHLRMDVLEMLTKAQSGHLGGSLSCVEILVALYYGKIASGPVLYFDPAKPGWDAQDYFVLSKGHAAPAWYSVLADLGFFDRSELSHFRQLNSRLQAYPHKKIPGVVFNSGIPGYGISAALGLAMCLKMERMNNRVYCLVGDGELQSGKVWETALTAAHYKLDNLTVIVDWNGLQSDGNTRTIMNVEPLADKFQSFGWRTIPVRNGHDFEELLFALERAQEVHRKPTAILAKTVKGKGVAFAEGKAFYHAEVLSPQELAEALPALQMLLEDHE